MADRRVQLFLVICLTAGLLAIVFTAITLRRGSGPRTRASASKPLAAPPARPYLMSVSTASDDTFRKVMLASLATPNGAAYSTSLACERAYFAAGRGVCLFQEGLIPKFYADIFDDRFVRLHRIALTGLPSRARISPDGRFAGITVFEQGHSYSDAGFSTRTTIIETTSGQSRGDLEQFEVTRDGKQFQAVDFNFWGITFARDGNRFFATLASGGTKYLVEGDVAKRTARVLRTGVECPSLSPDNTRIAYKSLLNREGMWQLRVYNLTTEADVPLAKETRSVDDQVDWLDNEHVLYHITGENGADVWALRTDGSEPPRVLRHFAYSPAVVR